MNVKQKTGLAVGAAVIGVGAVLGVGYAVAGTSGQAQVQAGESAEGTVEGGGPGGQGRGGQGPGGQDGTRGMGNLAAALAEKLGLEEDAVTEALQEVMQASRPDGGTDQGTPPSAGAQPSAGARPSQGAQPGGGGGEDRDAAIAKALAEKLGVDEAKVTAALAEIRSEQQANRPDDGGTAPQPSASASA
ncbi:MAG: hypothetical protein QM619_14515 [Micropruina sp.]|uniref:hypothetical protein n=1 Tax=Micropruina sp. TaxID=2737536 RepID=UPI0039E63FAE